MRHASFECLMPDGPISALPLKLHQSSPLSSGLLKLLLLIPVALTLLLPFGLLALEAAADPATRSALLASPLISLRLALSLAVWAALFGWPIMRIAGGLYRARTVTIDRHGVTVTERFLVRSATWSASLSEFDGLVHRVRASLSGTRHELVLLHPTRSRTVLVAVATEFSVSEVSRIAAMLGKPSIPASAIYRLRPVRSAVTAPATLMQPAEMPLAA